MNTKLFGQFLLERGLIDRDQMLDVIDEQQSLNPRVEDLAVALGLLTLGDVHSIRIEQMRRDEPFERVAMSLGLLTPTQLRDLTDRVQTKQILISQILLAKGYVELDDLVYAEYEYNLEGRRRAEELEELLERAGCGQVVSVAVQVLERMYERMMGDTLRIRDVTTEAAIDLGGRLWTQGLFIDAEAHTLAFQMVEASAIRLGSTLLGVELEGYDELVEDAVSEFLNVVIGHVCGNLDARPGSIRVQPPTVSSGADFFGSYPGAIVLEGKSGEVDFRFAIGSTIDARTTPHSLRRRTPSAASAGGPTS